MGKQSIYLLLFVALINIVYSVPNDLTIHGWGLKETNKELTVNDRTFYYYLDGLYNITADLYYSYTGGVSQYQKNFINISIDEGQVDITLTNITKQVNINQDLYLEIKINGTALSPRTNITSSAQSLTTRNINWSEINNTPNIAIDTFNTTFDISRAVNTTATNGSLMIGILCSNIVFSNGIGSSGICDGVDATGYNSLNDLKTAVSNDYHNLGGTDIDTYNKTSDFISGLQNGKFCVANGSSTITCNETISGITDTFNSTADIQRVQLINSTEDVRRVQLVNSTADILRIETYNKTQDFFSSIQNGKVCVGNGSLTATCNTTLPIDTDTFNSTTQMIIAVNNTGINILNATKWADLSKGTMTDGKWCYYDLSNNGIYCTLNAVVDTDTDTWRSTIDYSNVTNTPTIPTDPSTIACNNVTGASSNLCTLVDTDTDTFNTTAEMIKAVNNTGLNVLNSTLWKGITLGTLTDTYLCKYTSSGTQIVCNVLPIVDTYNSTADIFRTGLNTTADMRRYDTYNKTSDFLGKIENGKLCVGNGTGVAVCNTTISFTDTFNSTADIQRVQLFNTSADMMRYDTYNKTWDFISSLSNGKYCVANGTGTITCNTTISVITDTFNSTEDIQRVQLINNTQDILRTVNNSALSYNFNINRTVNASKGLEQGIYQYMLGVILNVNSSSSLSEMTTNRIKINANVTSMTTVSVCNGAGTSCGGMYIDAEGNLIIGKV